MERIVGRGFRSDDTLCKYCEGRLVEDSGMCEHIYYLEDRNDCSTCELNLRDMARGEECCQCCNCDYKM